MTKLTLTRTYAITKKVDRIFEIPIDVADTSEMLIKIKLLEFVWKDKQEQDDFLDFLSTTDVESIRQSEDGTFHAYSCVGYSMFEYTASPMVINVV